MSAAPPQPDLIGQLYEAQDKLSAAVAAGSGIASEEKSYQFILDAVKATNPAKQLAGQLIPQFFSHFPALEERAINAQLDLCEDENLNIRIVAIRGLEEFCKKSAHVQRIADVLGQLLLTEEQKEANTVKRTFNSVFLLDPKACFSALVQHILSGEDPREKAMAFFDVQVKALKSVIDRDEELQKHLADGIKKILQQEGAVNGDEFSKFLSLLFSLNKVSQSPEFSRDLGAIISAQAGLGKEFTGPKDLEKLVACLRHLLPLLNKDADNSAFLEHFFTKVAPVWDQLAIPDSEKLTLFRLLAEASRFVKPKTATDLFPALLTHFKQLVQLPSEKKSEAEPKEEKPAEEGKGGKAPAVAAAAVATGGAAGAAAAGAAGAVGGAVGGAGVEGDAKSKGPPKINFSAVECLLYMFHQFAHAAPDSVRDLTGVFVSSGQPGDFNTGELSAKREDFMSRLTQLELQYRGSTQKLQTLSKTIQDRLRAAKSEDEKKELRSKLDTVKTANSTIVGVQKLVSALKKDSKHPSFLGGKQAPILPWMTVAQAGGGAAGVKSTLVKRKPVGAGDHKDALLYRPPSVKRAKTGAPAGGAAAAVASDGQPGQPKGDAGQPRPSRGGGRGRGRGGGGGRGGRGGVAAAAVAALTGVSPAPAGGAGRGRIRNLKGRGPHRQATHF